MSLSQSNENANKVDIDSSNKIQLNLQEEKFKNLIQGLPENERLHQAEQIINYSDNYHGGKMPLASLYANCSMVICNHVKNDNSVQSKDYEEFKNSLDTSLECFLSEKKYTEEVKKLSDSKKSFLFLPTISTEHVFTTIIYKNGENYDIVAVNKGGRYDGRSNKSHYIFEKYTIPKENIYKTITNIAEHQNTNETIEIYDMLKENSIDNKYIEMKDINAREQRVGNCYYKEVEEGLKYVFSEAFDKYEIEHFFDGESMVKVKIPKGPVETEKFHEELLNNIKEQSEENTKKAIDGLNAVYKMNKTFRDRTFGKMELTMEEKKKIFFEIFGDANSEDKSSLGYLKKCLAKVDERTLKSNLDFFISILNEKDIEIPMIIYESLNMNFKVDFIESSDEYLEDTDSYIDIDFLKKYFPIVAERVVKSQMDDVISEINDSISDAREVNDTEYEQSLIEKGLKIIKNQKIRGRFYLKLAKLKEKQGYLKEAANLYKRAYEKCNHVDYELGQVCKEKYNKVMNNINKIIDEIKNIKYEGDYETNVLLGDKFAQIGDIKRAKEHYKDAINSVDVRTVQYEIFLKLAYVIEKREEKDKRKEALIIYDLALKKIDKFDYKNTIKVLSKKAKLLNKLGRAKEALEVYEDAINEMIENEEIGNTDAYDVEVKADLYKEIGDIYKNIGLLENMRDIYDEAVLEYKKALERIGDKREDMTANIENKIGEIYETDYRDGYVYNLGAKNEELASGANDIKREIKNIISQYNDPPKAIEVINKLLNKASEKAEESTLEDDIFDYALKQLIVIGKYEHAIGLIDKKISEQNKEENAILRQKKIICLRALGRKEEVIKECDNILSNIKGKEKKEKLCSEITFCKAKMLQELGQKEEALNEYHNLLKIYPKDTNKAIKIRNNRDIQESIGILTHELSEALIKQVENIFNKEEYSKEYIEKLVREAIMDGKYNRLKNALNADDKEDNIKSIIEFKEQVNKIHKSLNIKKDIVKEGDNTIQHKNIIDEKQKKVDEKIQINKESTKKMDNISKSNIQTEREL